MPGNPDDLLGYLRGAGGQIRALGSATIDGTATTHYTATIDLDEVAAHAPGTSGQAVKTLEQKLGTHTLPIQLWIDREGRLRQMTFTERIQQPPAGSKGTPAGSVTETVTERLLDFGVPVHVTAPPAGQTYDLTAKLDGGH